MLCVCVQSPSKASYNARSWQRDEETGDKEVCTVGRMLILPEQEVQGFVDHHTTKYSTVNSFTISTSPHSFTDEAVNELCLQTFILQKY